MKKLLLALLLIAGATASQGQVLVSTDFDTYDGTVGNIPAGFYISWNTGSSFYTGASTSCGVACNAYKFGVDSSTIITPSFSNADSVRFMMKGNGTAQPNKFMVYGSPDSTNWTLIHSFDTIPLAKAYYTFAVDPSYTNLMFYYQKDSAGLNVGFDDLYIYRGTINIGMEEAAKGAVSIFPNPSHGPVTVEVSNMTLHNVTVTITNILGKEMNRFYYPELTGRNAFDLGGLGEGVYMIREKSDKSDTLQRVLIRK